MLSHFKTNETTTNVINGTDALCMRDGLPMKLYFTLKCKWDSADVFT